MNQSRTNTTCNSGGAGTPVGCATHSQFGLHLCGAVLDIQLQLSNPAPKEQPHLLSAHRVVLLAVVEAVHSLLPLREPASPPLRLALEHHAQLRTAPRGGAPDTTALGPGKIPPAARWGALTAHQGP